MPRTRPTDRTPPRPIVIDCDPGTDDAVALLLAFAAPDALDIRAVTTVAGNVPASRTLANALKIRDLAGREDVPVHGGCAAPLIGAGRTAAEVHGDDGLGGLVLPSPAGGAASAHAVDALIRAIEDRPGAVTIVAVGPLTNLALALAKRRDLVPAIGEIVLMGGAVGPGNVTPHAEFNLHVDPHAGRMVFEAGAPVVMIGLDVTHQVRCTRDRLAALAALGTPAARAAARLMARGNGEERGAALHDPCAIAYLLRPGLFTGAPARVAVTTAETAEIGRTTVDFAAPPNALVPTGVDADGVFALIEERLSP